ncbi:MAG TPA: hypothetical protein VGI58_13495 [Streptosporangiaceae bacterium]
MTISIQTLHDALIALTVTVGVAVALSIAIIAIGSFVERGKKDAAKAARAITHHATEDTREDTRELVLR